MMGSKVNKTGPWILQNNPDLTILIDKLNSRLPLGARPVVVMYDSANLPHAMNDSDYKSMSAVEPVSIVQHFGPSDWPHIRIPLGIGINIPLTPLEWNGTSHPAVVDIIGDFINIKVPYLFKVVPDRIDTKTYTIIAVEE